MEGCIASRWQSGCFSGPKPFLISEVFEPSIHGREWGAGAAGISKEDQVAPFRGRWLPQGCWGLPILRWDEDEITFLDFVLLL